MSLRVRVQTSLAAEPAFVTADVALPATPSTFGPLATSDYGSGPYPVGANASGDQIALFGDGLFIAPRFYSLDGQGNVNFVAGFQYANFGSIDGFVLVPGAPPRTFGPLAVAAYSAGPYPVQASGTYNVLALFASSGQYIPPRFYTIDSNGNLTFAQGFNFALYDSFDGFFL